MNFDRNVSCFIAVYALMDNDFFNQAIKGSCVQFRDVGVFLNGFYHWRASYASRISSASFFRPSSTLLSTRLFLLRLFHQQIEVRFADTSGNHVLIQPQNHLFQNVNAFLVFGKGAFQRFPLAFCSASQVSDSFPATASPSIRAALAHSRILFSTSRYRVSYSTRCWEQCCFP